VSVISIHRVKRLNAEKGHHFFSESNIRFFSSRCAQSAYRVGNTAYFVTSERPNRLTPRRYTVRKIDMGTGEIDNEGGFLLYASRVQANAAMMRLARDA
jgi:hypothetical protein